MKGQWYAKERIESKIVLSAISKVAKTQQIYTVEMEMYAGEWHPKFSFHATDEKDAESKLHGWNRHHGFPPSRMRKATEQEAAHWIHDEYVS